MIQARGLTTFDAMACRSRQADAINAPMTRKRSRESDCQRGAGVMLKSASAVVPVVRRMLDRFSITPPASRHVGSRIPNAPAYIVEKSPPLPSHVLPLTNPWREHRIA